VNTIANFSLVHTYINPFEKLLEVEFNFPVNPKAGVYRFMPEYGNKSSEELM
jgi:hypothetical protein